MISLIVAMDEQQGIGLHGQLPWHHPEDLALFKQLTLHKTVVMGRKTYESIGKALPHRMNYVVTQSTALFNEHTTLKRLDNYQAFLRQHCISDEEIFIIGGMRIYEAALPYVRHFYVSHIHGQYDCDTYFPPFDFSNLICVEKQSYDQFTFCHYQQEPPCTTSSFG